MKIVSVDQRHPWMKEYDCRLDEYRSLSSIEKLSYRAHKQLIKEWYDYEVDPVEVHSFAQYYRKEGYVPMSAGAVDLGMSDQQYLFWKLKYGD